MRISPRRNSRHVEQMFIKLIVGSFTLSTLHTALFVETLNFTLDTTTHSRSCANLWCNLQNTYGATKMF